jgi:hypothetical protein
MAYIGPITQQLLDGFSKEFSKSETKEKIMKNIVEPVMNGLFRKYLSYILCFIIMQMMIIGLLIYIICKM